MIKNKILSIIIPAYNCSKTIKNTILSIDFESNPDLEVLIIDDGSTISFKKEIQMFLKKYHEQILYFKKPNGNWGSVINFALKKVNGLYIKTLDSDDTFDRISLNAFMEIIRKNLYKNIDLFITNYSFINIEKNKINKREFSTVKKLWKIIPIYNVNFRLNLTVHNCTISKKIYKDFVPLPEKCFYSDNNFIFQVLMKTENVCMINKDIYLYEYYIGDAQQSININTTIKNFSDLIEVFNSIIKLSINDTLNKKRKKILSKQIRLLYYWIILVLSLDKNKSFEKKKKILLILSDAIRKINNKKLFKDSYKLSDLLIINSFSKKIIIKIINLIYPILNNGYISHIKSKNELMNQTKKGRKIYDKAKKMNLKDRF